MRPNQPLQRMRKWRTPLSSVVITPFVVAFQVYVTKCNIENFGYGDFLGYLP
jgi:hypothetical protein